MTTSMKEQVSPPVSATAQVSVGDIVLQPVQWANEAQELAADYQGLPEATIFLNFARRFHAMAKAFEKPICKCNN